MMALVSVLLCTNMVDQYLDVAIDSILNQKFKELELIVVLNGKALESELSLKAKYLKNAKVKILSSNIMFINHSLNIGIDHAAGKYIARMDADDISYPERITVQHNFLESHPHVIVCGSSFELIDSDGAAIKQIVRPVSSMEIRKSLIYGNPLCHPSVMFRRDDIRKVGGYLNGEYAEDYDLWVRLARAPKVTFANVPNVLLGYRSIASGQARGSKKAYRSISSTQWGEWCRSGDPRWLFSAILSLTKAVFIGK